MVSRFDGVCQDAVARLGGLGGEPVAEVGELQRLAGGSSGEPTVT
jgi:hypothetical protein